MNESPNVPPIGQQELFQVTGVIGERATAYLLGLESEDEFASQRHSVQLSPPQTEVLGYLAELCRQPRGLNSQAWVVSNAVGTVDPNSGESVANALRSYAGGSVVQTGDFEVSDDSVLAGVLVIARDLFAQLLIPPDEWYAEPNLSAWIHPRGEEARDAVVSDPALSKLFHSEDLGLGRRGFVLTADGSGGTVQSSQIPDRLIQNAWRACNRGDGQPTLEHLLAGIKVELDRLRMAARGDAAICETTRVFTGLTTRGRSIETPWGALEPMSEGLRASAPRGVSGGTSTQLADGTLVQIDYRGELVLRTTEPWALTAFDRDPEPEEWGDAVQRAKHAKDEQDLIRKLQLAFLLATMSDSVHKAKLLLSWTESEDPLASGRRYSFAFPDTFRYAVPTELTVEQCKSVERWAELIEKRSLRNVDVAVERCLGAAIERVQPVDRLVDAVVAMEALFGGRNELTFRVSAAIAWLLGSSGPERSAIAKEVKDLYSLRSKVVHGGSTSGIDLYGKSQQALDFVLRAFAALLERRPDLLKIRESAERGQALILGLGATPED